MKKTWKKTGTQILAVGAVAAVTLFLSEIGMRYDNVGSRTGLIISLFILILTSLTLKESPLSKPERLMIKAGKPIGLVLLGIAVLTTGFMILGIPQEKQSEKETVVILGSGVNSDGRPSAVMQTRVDAALQYLKNHPDAAIVVSGGQHGDAPISEAESMKEVLLEQGISEEQIYLEPDSRTTAENLRYTAELIRKNGLSTTIALVTSEFHLARSCLYAERNGLKPIPVKAATPWYCLPAYYIREMYAVIDAFLIHKI